MFIDNSLGRLLVILLHVYLQIMSCRCRISHPAVFSIRPTHGTDAKPLSFLRVFEMHSYLLLYDSPAHSCSPYIFFTLDFAELEQAALKVAKEGCADAACVVQIREGNDRIGLRQLHCLLTKLAEDHGGLASLSRRPFSSALSQLATAIDE